MSTLSQSTRRERLSSKSVADLKPKNTQIKFRKWIYVLKNTWQNMSACSVLLLAWCFSPDQFKDYHFYQRLSHSSTHAPCAKSDREKCGESISQSLGGRCADNVGLVIESVFSKSIFWWRLKTQYHANFVAVILHRHCLVFSQAFKWTWGKWAYGWCSG